MRMFETLNSLGHSLYCLRGSNPDEILEQLQKITLPVRIVSMYGDSKQHFAWIATDAKIVKTQKGKVKENG